MNKTRFVLLEKDTIQDWEAIAISWTTGNTENTENNHWPSFSSSTLKKKLRQAFQKKPLFWKPPFCSFIWSHLFSGQGGVDKISVGTTPLRSSHQGSASRECWRSNIEAPTIPQTLRSIFCSQRCHKFLKTININSLHGGMVMTYRPMDRDLSDGANEPERSWIRNLDMLDFKAKKSRSICDIPPSINSTDCLNSGWFPWQHKLSNRFSQIFRQMFHRSSVKLFGIWWCFMRSVLWIHWVSFRVLNLKSQVWKLEIPWNPHLLPKKKTLHFFIPGVCSDHHWRHRWIEDAQRDHETVLGDI